MRTQIAAQLKASHPHPVTSKCQIEKEGRQDYYCVGGTLVANYTTAANPRIPSAYEIAAAIRVLAPAQQYPHTFAQKIIRFNDDGQFDEAWQLLDLALDSQPLPAYCPPAPEEEPAPKDEEIGFGEAKVAAEEA
jgi:hypothetical protein